MESVKFIMGSGAGQKPPGPRINDGLLKDCDVNLVIVSSVPNNDTFNHDPLTGDLNAGNDVGFPNSAIVTVFYTPSKQCF